ncbi:hypothetical protein DY000_02001169 [Brassica cretica]|uniref:Ubiquitin-like domain-containing protein n=1 Tax=Brassica cretica TaxID=69181 RepID=A0ABQ7CEE7_BRACR|nr:hypothetical protein DY000_02001169 [Brassica cretica]
MAHPLTVSGKDHLEGPVEMIFLFRSSKFAWLDLTRTHPFSSFLFVAGELLLFVVGALTFFFPLESEKKKPNFLRFSILVISPGKQSQSAAEEERIAMYIRVKRMKATYFIQCDPTETVLDVKQKLFTLIEQPVSNQRLILMCTEEVLEDSKSLAEQKVENDEVVALTLRKDDGDFEDVDIAQPTDFSVA